QLKNIAEQIAVLEKERVITAQILQSYLPNERTSTLPMRLENKANEDFSERDLLYKVLFDMKKDMVELKKLVVELLKNGINSNTISDNSPYLNQLYREVQPNTSSSNET